MTNELVLEVSEVEKSYGFVKALDRVSFELRRGEIHALCGHNGAGKSTLARIITGQVTPDRGELKIDGQSVEFSSPRDAEAYGVAVVDQELSVVPALSVEENLLLGSINSPWFVRGNAARQSLRQALGRVGLESLNLKTLVEKLSMGERQLLEIARGLSRNAKVLVLDEPTASLSRVEIARAFAAVRSAAESGCAIIFVSHRLDEVSELCERITVMRDGRIVDTRQVAEVDKSKVIAMMVGDEFTASVRHAEPKQVGEAMVSVEHLSVPGTVGDFEVQIHSGEIIALAGQIGSGTTDVLRALAGLTPEASAQVEMRGRALRLGDPRRSFGAGMQYISGDRKSEGLFLEQSVAQNLVATRLSDHAKGGWLNFGAIRRLVSRLADIVGIDPSRISSAVGVLSGGNQQKVFIGRALEREGTAVILLDEPTRGVDVMGRSEIHDLLRKAANDGKAILYTSTELDEILDLADHVVTMFDGEIVRSGPVKQFSAADILADMTHRVKAAATGFASDGRGPAEVEASGQGDGNAG